MHMNVYMAMTVKLNYINKIKKLKWQQEAEMEVF